MIRDNTFIELRGYLNIAKRRWPLIILPALVVLALAALRFEIPKETYTIGVQFIVGQPATEQSTNDAQSRQWEWVASQYVVNSVTDWADGSEFANLVDQHLERNGYEEDDFNVKTLDDSIAALTIRSRLTMIAQHTDREELLDIANAIVIILEDFEVGNIAVLPQIGDIPPQIVQIDTINDDMIETISPGLGGLLQWPLRIGVAMGTGLVFAFMIEYLDPKIHEKRQIETMDIPVVGSIPR